MAKSQMPLVLKMRAGLRPLVQAFLKGTGNLESGVNDVVW